MSSATSRILVCGVNWLGDSCMTMPALQVFRRRRPDAHLAILVKPALGALWRLHAAPDEVLTLEPGHLGLWRTAAALRKGRFDTAYVFPNSWRSALAPFLAGIPRRIGAGGSARQFLLTSQIRLSEQTHARHQQWEYADILQLGPMDAMPAPVLTLDPECSAIPPAAPGTRTLGLIPGAARGTSKQWPETHYLAAAREIRIAVPRCRFVIFGTAAEAPICRRLADALQPDAVSLAGGTTLPQLAASLAACDTVICNDSGGMHLAAAAGTPVVAVFGLTDHAKTGPMGGTHQCIRADHPRASRNIARHDAEAASALAGIAPSRVAQAALKNLNSVRPSPS